ncbi:hypothetical protein J4Q44_G00279280 [Coregonus suidteri]|uniref:Uncharacterized protein n=1 Tax=Coregonus suidteri TaxID=861788 RepID=A0AAN8L5C6_9TELE
MVNSYGHDGAMKISLEILRKINQNDLTKNCHIDGPVHFNIRVNSIDDEPIVPSKASPAHLTMFEPVPVNTEDNNERIER